MYLWKQTVTVYRKADGDYVRTVLHGCSAAEKVQASETGGVYIREKVYTCRIPTLLGFLPEVNDIICIGNERDMPIPGKEGRFVESRRAFIVREVKYNTLAGVLPHYRASSRVITEK